ncbi:MAG: dUTP diphosphatase [Candidatus Moraniibacteriota bacterium]|jgi:dUTP diphosphatase
MNIKIKKINPEAKLPQYTIEGDAAMELYSIEDIVLSPGDIVACQTGISMAIPDGFVGLIWDKSGIAFKGGLKTMGGVIDSNYRGEIGVIIRNLSKKDYKINKGDKIAQMLIQRVECPIIEEVDELDETQRGDGGFGSTGLK